MLKELLGELYTPEIEAKVAGKKLILDNGSYIPKKEKEDLEIAHAKEITELKLGQAIDGELAKAGAVNHKAVKALLDLSKISLKDTGELDGLTNQLDKIKESEKWAFGAAAPVAGAGGNPDTSGSGTKDNNNLAGGIVF